jgi:hypothetical protein
MSYMNLEEHGTSLEKALKNVGRQTNLYPRHSESSFKRCVKDEKALIILYKNLI